MRTVRLLACTICGTVRISDAERCQVCVAQGLQYTPASYLIETYRERERRGDSVVVEYLPVKFNVVKELRPGECQESK